jgi:hypothetical protein
MRLIMGTRQADRTLRPGTNRNSPTVLRNLGDFYESADKVILMLAIGISKACGVETHTKQMNWIPSKPFLVTIRRAHHTCQC